MSKLYPELDGVKLNSIQKIAIYLSYLPFLSFVLYIFSLVFVSKTLALGGIVWIFITFFVQGFWGFLFGALFYIGGRAAGPKLITGWKAKRYGFFMMLSCSLFCLAIIINI